MEESAATMSSLSRAMPPRWLLRVCCHQCWGPSVVAKEVRRVSTPESCSRASRDSSLVELYLVELLDDPAYSKVRTGRR